MSNPQRIFEQVNEEQEWKIQYISGIVPRHDHYECIALIANVLNNNTHVIANLNKEVEELKRELSDLKERLEV